MGAVLSGHSVTRECQTALIISKLQLVLDDPALCRKFFACRGSDAQVLLDTLQWLLDSSELDLDFRRIVTAVIQKLSIRADLCPTCFRLKGVVSQSPYAIAGGRFADIYTGIFEGQMVCMKVMRVYKKKKSVLKAFSKELIIWGQLRHTNIIPIYGVCTHRGLPCIVSPFMENGHIGKYLKKNPSASRIQLADDAAQGLSYLHTRNIVHGDLKGPNILVTDTGRASLTDFGISSISYPEFLKWASLSSEESRGGSIRWQAPELFVGDDSKTTKNTKASDVYALGCVFFEIFTKERLYTKFSRNSQVILYVQSGGRPTRPQPPSLGPSNHTWRLMEDCWKRGPLDRPSIGDVIRRLEPELSQDVRSTGSDPMAPEYFRRKMANSVDTVTALRVLKGISGLVCGPDGTKYSQAGSSTEEGPTRLDRDATFINTVTKGRKLKLLLAMVMKVLHKKAPINNSVGEIRIAPVKESGTPEDNQDLPRVILDTDAASWLLAPFEDDQAENDISIPNLASITPWTNDVAATNGANTAQTPQKVRHKGEFVAQPIGRSAHGSPPTILDTNDLTIMESPGHDTIIRPTILGVATTSDLVTGPMVDPLRFKPPDR